MRGVKDLAIIALGALLAAPATGLSQTASRTLRVAILDDASEATRAPLWQLVRNRLRELGYAEGKNLVIEQRHSRGVAARLPTLAAELIALKPEVLITVSTPGTRAAIQATSTIPVVFIGIADPVASGFVRSLAHPGGNATGLSIIATELGAKWVELLREIVPQGKRVAYLSDSTNLGSVLVFERLRDHARRFDITVEMFDGKSSGLERSLETIAREGFAGLIVGNPGTIFDSRDRIVQFAARQKLPAVYARREYTDAGGLLSYGVDIGAMYRRAADYVHKIAQGAKPADLPVERPDTFRMVLNLKTSRALGISIPPSIRHRADELID